MRGVQVPHTLQYALKIWQPFKAYPPPSLAEQERIGEFFRSQDEGLAAVGEQIERLKVMKQACLERMFV